MLKQSSRKLENKFKISSKPLIIVVSAPSGAGKTTLVEHLLRRDSDMQRVVTHTTRSPRPNEKDKVDYHFVTDERFRAMVRGGEFVEWARVYDRKYGTSKKAIQRVLDKKLDAVLVIEEQGARKIKKLYPDDAIFILLLPPSMKELRRRITKRKGMKRAEIDKRLRLAKKEIVSMLWYDYVLVNQDLKKTVENFYHILHAERYKAANVTLT